MKVNIGKSGWEKRSVIEKILNELEANNKTTENIEYIIKKGQVKYWITWAEFISPEIKIKSHDNIDFIIVGNNWWIEGEWVGDEDYPEWVFRTKPECPKFNYEQYLKWEVKCFKWG